MRPPENIGALQNQLADRWDEHPPSDWNPEMLKVMIAVFDLYRENNPHSAVVLELVRS